VLLKRHFGSLWRSTEESEGSSGTWWRTRRGIQHSWRELGPQWSGDGVQKKRTERWRVEMKRRGPRMALGKVKKRGLYCLPSVRIVVLLIEF